jgi:hypothetical protein
MRGRDLADRCPVHKKAAAALVDSQGMQASRIGRTTVAVRPETALRARPRLFAALEDAFPVAFSSVGAEAAIAFGSAAAGEALPTLVFEEAGDREVDATVRLSEDAALDRRLWDLELGDLSAGGLGRVEDSARVLAVVGAEPVWAQTPGPPALARVAASLSELEPSRTLRELLDERPLAMLALIEFLRAVSAAHAHRPPPLRAAFLFDDPNLRWRTYGFIDFRRLLDHAEAHGYHAAMATIPLDAGRQHRATVELFRGNPRRLSLIYHGNDHLSGELLRVGGVGEATSIVAQALRRAARVESRYGLRVDRVMTPPHGMCSAEVASALGPLGFDALCAIHPFPWTESPPADRPLAGWEPAGFAAGCAVIPRLPLSAGRAEIAIRAYLDQPLVLYGHHDDLAGGLDLLAATAQTVNSLGAVRWTSLGEIATSNAAVALRGSTLHVRPHSHRLRLEAHEANSIVVEGPPGTEETFDGWSDGRGRALPFDEPVPHEEDRLEIQLVPKSPIDPYAVPAPPASAWPLLRRAATETRDRLRPLIRAGT